MRRSRTNPEQTSRTDTQPTTNPCQYATSSRNKKREEEKEGKEQESHNVKEELAKMSEGIHIHIWTDGSARPNPGPGGWAALIDRNGAEIDRLSGADPDSTNQRMEITAVIAGLRWVLRENALKATVHTDSRYTMDGANEWLAGWKRRGWRKSSGEPVKNRDLWEQIDDCLTRLAKRGADVEVKWMKGHAGHPRNEAADRAANAARANALENPTRQPREANSHAPPEQPGHLRFKHDHDGWKWTATGLDDSFEMVWQITGDAESLKECERAGHACAAARAQVQGRRWRRIQ